MPPSVDGRVEGTTYRLTFQSGPDAGAQFLITSANRTDGLWTYTTEAGKTLSDAWNTIYSAGATDLTVHGPNGFLRTFRGKPTTTVEIDARHNPGTGNLDLTIISTITTRLTLTNTYTNRTKHLNLTPGTTKHTVNLAPTHRWYDLKFLVPADPTYLRHYAGHVETGTPGLTDPGIITA